MNLYLNSRLLNLEVLKNLDVILKDYFNSENPDGEKKWSPVTTESIYNAELYYNPINDFFTWYNSELSRVTTKYLYDEVEVNYIKNSLYYSKGKSRVLDIFSDLLRSRQSVSTDEYISMNFTYDYNFPELSLLITEVTNVNPTILINKLINVIYYLLFFDDNNLKVIIDQLNLVINENLLEYKLYDKLSYSLVAESSDAYYDIQSTYTEI